MKFGKLWAGAMVVLLMFTACGTQEMESKNPEGDGNYLGGSKLVPEAQAGVQAGSVEDDGNVYDAGNGFYQSEKGNFRISFPGEPVVSAQPISLGEAGSITMNGYTYTDGGDKIFMVAYSGVPVTEISEEKARVFLKDEQAGALGTFGLEKADEEWQSDLGDFPGLFYRARVPDKFYIAAQTYLIGSRLYQIEILKVSAYPTEEELEGFTRTFRILK